MTKILFILTIILLSSCDKNNNDKITQQDMGVCDESLFEIVEDDGFIIIIVDLKMDDHLHELPKEEKREAILKLQEEFIKSLEGINVSVITEGRGVISPWVSIDVDDKEALIFICNDERVNSVHHDEPESFD